MNLVTDIWLPCKFKDGSVKEIAIAEIANPDVIDLALPRADFQGAAYQLLIGLLQTVMAPEHRKEWHQRYNNPPTKDELQKQLDKVAHAFNVTGDGPLFMQDLDPLEGGEKISISELLIGSPGKSTLEKNRDLFIKRQDSMALSEPMAALALFTWQLNGISVTWGYRAGVRKSGPLTVLLKPRKIDSPLWQRLWLNIISKSVWSYEAPNFDSSLLFPWLGKTKFSDVKNSEIYPSEMHELAVYWAMPNRIRLVSKNSETTCYLTGLVKSKGVFWIKREQYGNNYKGDWFHPFTPYSFNPKKYEDCTPIMTNVKSISYQMWDSISFTSATYNQKSALVISNFYNMASSKAGKVLGDVPILWCFGYDAEQGMNKVNGWYSSSMPFIYVPYDLQEDFIRALKEIINLTKAVSKCLEQHLQAAMFEDCLVALLDPKDKKAGKKCRAKKASEKTFFVQSNIEFWARTEQIFFDAVQSLSEQENYYPLSTEAASVWLKGIQNTVTDLFDEHTLSVDIGEPRILKRVMKARRFLSIWVYSSRDIKNFKQQHAIDIEKEVA